MTQLNRRNLFSIGFASAGLSLAPSWITRWFSATEHAGPQDPLDAIADARKKQLGEAFERARQQGKPVLVLIVPDDEDQVWLAGSWFGAFLNHGGSLAMLELGMTVPACAKVGELGKATGAKLPAKPTMVLVSPGERDKVTPIEVELGLVGGAEFDPAEEWQEREKRETKHIVGKLDELTKALIKGMHRHGCNVATLAAAARSKMSAGDRERLQAWFTGGEAPADQLILRAAAEVRRAAGERSDERRKVLLAALELAVVREIVKQPIAGARWVSSTGCAMDLERETEQDKKNRLGIACGMGHTPPQTTRFLSFFHAPWRG